MNVSYKLAVTCWTVVALLCIALICCLVLEEKVVEQKDQEIQAWQHAAARIWHKRGMAGEPQKPTDLTNALNPFTAMTHYEHGKMGSYYQSNGIVYERGAHGFDIPVWDITNQAEINPSF